MNKQGQMNYVGIIVIAAICVIIGASLLSVPAADVGNMNNKQTVINETMSLTNSRVGGTTINITKWHNLANGCPFSIGNWRLSDTSDCTVSSLSGVLGNGTTLVLNTDYTFNTTAGTGVSACSVNVGDIVFKNTPAVNNSNNVTKWTYTYCQDGYIPISNPGARAVLPLIIIFFALLIMSVALIPIFRQGFLEMVGLR